MKKVIYSAILFMVSVNTLHAQSFLDRAKAKAAQALQSKTPAAAQQAVADSKYTGPSKFGTVLMTYSRADVDKHMGGSDGGFNLWFSSISVVNNQLQFTVIDYDNTLGTYSNGQFQKGSGTVNNNNQNNIPDGNEMEQKSTDFSQIDATNGILKRGATVGTRLPGKPTQTYTFKGKVIGNYMMANLAHNADSTAIALVATGYDSKGLNYTLITSTGQSTSLPIKIQGWPIISPDGKTAAAIVQLLTGAGCDVFLTNGSKITIGVYDSNAGVWLHNSGAVYYINNANNKEVMKNGTSFLVSDFQINPKKLFISANDATACWAGERGLHFSDGSVFENGSCPHKLIINGKEVIVFLDIDIPSGKLYLCRHDL